MCLGVPVRVVDCRSHTAHCEGRAGPVQVDLSLVGPQPAGTWLLAFLDVAREVIDGERASRIAAALDGLAAAMAGETDLDRHFADLVGREPELPAHLRAARCGSETKPSANGRE